MRANGTVSIRREDLASLAQIVHQAYHGDDPGTWRTCRYATCSRIAKMLEPAVEQPWVGSEDVLPVGVAESEMEVLR